MSFVLEWSWKFSLEGRASRNGGTASTLSLLPHLEQASGSLTSRSADLHRPKPVACYSERTLRKDRTRLQTWVHLHGRVGYYYYTVRVDHDHSHKLHPDHSTIPADIRSMNTPQDIAAHGGCKPLSEEDRQLKVRFLRDQLREYEKPHEQLWEMVVGQPSLIAAVKIGLDVNLFQSWAEACGGTLANEQLTLTELSWLVDIELGTMSK
jgi:hypothetical protein